MNTYKLIEYLENNKIEFVIEDIYDDDVDVAEYIENDKFDELIDHVVDIEIVGAMEGKKEEVDYIDYISFGY